MAARQEGILSGSPTSSGGIHVWLQNMGHAVPVVWSAGFSALLDPLEILDPDGTVVARAGDYLQVGGGFVPGPVQKAGAEGSVFHIQTIIEVLPAPDSES
jgi:hypothetical protein